MPLVASALKTGVVLFQTSGEEVGPGAGAGDQQHVPYTRVARVREVGLGHDGHQARADSVDDVVLDALRQGQQRQRRIEVLARDREQL